MDKIKKPLCVLLILALGLKEAHAAEEQSNHQQRAHVKSRLNARGKDALKDGLEESELAVNSIEEFVDVGQLGTGKAPLQALSAKQVHVPVPANKTHTIKATL